MSCQGRVYPINNPSLLSNMGTEEAEWGIFFKPCVKCDPCSGEPIIPECKIPYIENENCTKIYCGDPNENVDLETPDGCVCPPLCLPKKIDYCKIKRATDTCGALPKNMIAAQKSFIQSKMTPNEFANFINGAVTGLATNGPGQLGIFGRRIPLSAVYLVNQEQDGVLPAIPCPNEGIVYSFNASSTQGGCITEQKAIPPLHVPLKAFYPVLPGNCGYKDCEDIICDFVPLQPPCQLEGDCTTEYFCDKTCNSS